MTSNIHNNNHILQQIEWESIKKRVSNYSHFDSTQKSIFSGASTVNTQVLLDKTDLFFSLHHEEFIRSIQQDLFLLPVSTDFDLLLNSLEKHKAIKISSLNIIANAIEINWDHFSHFDKLQLLHYSKDDHNKLKQQINHQFLKTFRKFVSREGEVNYENHPALRPLYLKKIELEQKIRKSINYQLNDSSFSANLQFNSFDIINDRFVIPIKSDHYKNDMGQIISRSDSGHTLFVEMFSIGKDNSKRVEYILEIEKILSKIELETTILLSEFLKDLSAYFNAIKSFDEFLTRAKFAFETGLCKPILSKTPKIELKNFFHPLIENPIKNDLSLSADKHGLIISGPNTGGKTATLKTLALIQFFLNHGLFIPASEANVFQYDSIFYFGNDGQNLEEGLSSFAAEVKNYTELFNSLTDSNLIVIDEIFNTTSSEEASALALSIFKQLELFSNTHIVVSTHHQTLKTLLHNESEYISAHVGFDIESNSPTYKLHLGSPGSSFALNIFKNMISQELNLDNVLKNAYSFLDNKTMHYEKLLAKVSEKENELNKTLEENKELNNILKNKNSAMEGVLKLKLDEKIKHAQSSIDEYIAKARQALRDSKNQKISKAKSLDNIEHDIKKSLKKLSPFEEKYNEKTHTNLTIPTEYKEGEHYFSTLLNTTVLLKRINHKKGEALVSSGNLNLKTPLSKLMLANATSTKKSLEPALSINFNNDSKLEYDCRGMRLEEFETLVEKAISSLLLGHIPYLNIIHGHGTGVLKGWLRKFIKNHPEIKQDQDEDGNDGSTRIVLK